MNQSIKQNPTQSQRNKVSGHVNAYCFNVLKLTLNKVLTHSFVYCVLIFQTENKLFTTFIITLLRLFNLLTQKKCHNSDLCCNHTHNMTVALINIKLFIEKSTEQRYHDIWAIFQSHSARKSFPFPLL